MPQPLRIIFMGTPEFAASSLSSLLDGEDEIVAVITQPDKAKGRSGKLQPPPVKVVAQEAGIPVLQPTSDIKSEQFHKGIASYQPDLIVVVAYGRLLPKNILDLPPFGCINLHASLLPKYRGAAPIQWAIINNEQEVGVTIMQMDEGMDTGDMLCRSRITVNPDETSASLFDRLAALGSETLKKAILGLKAGSMIAQPQDHDRASYAPRLEKKDGLIDWGKSAQILEPLIRGLDPWPAAFSFLGGKRLRLFSPEIVFLDTEAEPGTILRADKAGFIIACGENALQIHTVQPEGKKKMPADVWLRGTQLTPGTRLSSSQEK